LLERLLVDWKISTIPKGEIRTNGKGPFILTTRPYNTRTVMEQLEQLAFKRMEHLPYSQDLALSDLFLFVYMNKQLKGRSFAEDGELLSMLSEQISEIPPDMILQVFTDWDRRIRRCLLMEKGYVE
jgi:hypothetical protein